MGYASVGRSTGGGDSERIWCGLRRTRQAPVRPGSILGAHWERSCSWYEMVR